MAFVKRGVQLTLSSAHEAYSHLHAMGVRKHTRHAATSTIALYHGSHLLVIKARKIEHAAASAKLVGRCERRCRVAKDDTETKKKACWRNQATKSQQKALEQRHALTPFLPFLRNTIQHPMILCFSVPSPVATRHAPAPSLMMSDARRRARVKAAATCVLWETKPGCG